MTSDEKIQAIRDGALLEAMQRTIRQARVIPRWTREEVLINAGFTALEIERMSPELQKWAEKERL